ncbi:MAG: hypothetical protein ACOYM2_11070 [Rectinemataceae bacterium]
MKDILQAQGGDLFAGVEQFHHLDLREPYGLAIRAEPDLAIPVLDGVEDQLGHGFGSAFGRVT